jgi:hypothetical protein
MLFISVEPCESNGDQGTLHEALRRLPRGTTRGDRTGVLSGLTHSRSPNAAGASGTIRARLRRGMHG